jgi:hypothetical protein
MKSNKLFWGYTENLRQEALSRSKSLANRMKGIGSGRAPQSSQNRTEDTTETSPEGCEGLLNSFYGH